MVQTVHLRRTASLRKDSMFAPPARVARRVRDMRCTYCLEAAAVSGSHTSLWWCHGTRYARHARSWYACGVHAVHGAREQAALRLWYVQHAGGEYA